MALTFTNLLHGGVRTTKQEGLIESDVEITTSVGSVSPDYPVGVGFAIQANASKMGFRQVVDVLVGSARSSSNVVLSIAWSYDPIQGTLRAFTTTAGVAVTEATTTSHIPAGAIIRVLVRGV